jgi:tRNA pseudouridine synthase 10
MLEKYPFCDNCLGRQFAMLAYGIDNKKRGETLKLLLTMIGQQKALSNNKDGITLLKNLATNGSFKMARIILKKIRKRAYKEKTCHICQGKMKILTKLADQAVKELQKLEYSTFLVGMEIPTEVEEREDELKAKFELKYGENIRNEFSREIGKIIAIKTRKEVNYKTPDILILINPFTEQLTIKINPLYIGGRYKKLIRGVPQSKWFCTECRGKGCSKCNWTGKMYPESVEELIGEPIKKITKGTDISFHASGREDIDARMLGKGRPFIIEIKDPKKRFLDLKKLEETINQQAKNKISVSELYFATKDDVRKLKKAEKAEKIYRVIVKFNRDITDEEIALLEKTLTNRLIRQKTPTRVLHRRTDKIREKHIYKTKIKRLTSNTIRMKIHCEGGLYIKELITSDKGRTTPSVSQILNIEATPLKLDVLNILTRNKK